MKKQKVGRILFWIGVVCILLDFIARWIQAGVCRINTPETLVGTGWATGEILFNILSLSTLIGVSFSLIGALLSSEEKGSLFWLWALAPIIGMNLGLLWNPSIHIPAVYGIGAAIITLSYLGVLWGWMKTHNMYEGIAKKGKKVQLLGYSFLYITALFLCNYIGNPMNPGTGDFPSVSGYSILLTLSISFVLLSWGNYLSAKPPK